MAQQVQELIDKIKSEGVQAAESKANEIQEQAQAKAKQIVDEAQKRSERLIVEAREEIKKMQESTHMALKQASRDTLLSLRKEIEHMLTKIISQQVGDSLSADTMAKIIESIAKSSSDKNSNENIVVTVGDADLKQLKDGLMSKLQKEVKQSIVVQTSGDVGKGFLISFDSGKSSFDFTEESLAKFLSSFVNEQMSQLIQESTAS